MSRKMVKHIWQYVKNGQKDRLYKVYVHNKNPQKGGASVRDEEIVKALECCSLYDGYACKICPIDFKDCSNGHLEKFALDLINRQNETIEQLQTALFKCGEDAVEIENYKKIAEYQQSLSMDRFFEIQRLKEEIERLEKNLDEKNEELDGLYDDLADAVETTAVIRAKAVKEFAEKLKTNVFEVDDINEDTFLAVEVSYIDYLVKEFTEGGDGNQSMQEKLP